MTLVSMTIVTWFLYPQKMQRHNVFTSSMFLRGHYVELSPTSCRVRFADCTGIIKKFPVSVGNFRSRWTASFMIAITKMSTTTVTPIFAANKDAGFMYCLWLLHPCICGTPWNSVKRMDLQVIRVFSYEDHFILKRLDWQRQESFIWTGKSKSLIFVDRKNSSQSIIFISKTFLINSTFL